MQASGKAAVATEIGRSPHDGSSFNPWDAVPAAVDRQEQSDYLTAFLMNATEHLDGVLFWSYKTQPDSDVYEKAFDLRKKPSEDIMRIWLHSVSEQ